MPKPETQRNSSRGPGRPRTVGNDVAYLVKMPRDLDGLVRAAAKEDGVSVAEWWRAAAVGALLLRTQERAAWTGLLERQRVSATEQPKSMLVRMRPGVSYRLPGDADPDEPTLPRGKPTK